MKCEIDGCLGDAEIRASSPKRGVVWLCVRCAKDLAILAKNTVIKPDAMSKMYGGS